LALDELQSFADLPIAPTGPVAIVPIDQGFEEEDELEEPSPPIAVEPLMGLEPPAAELRSQPLPLVALVPLIIRAGRGAVEPDPAVLSATPGADGAVRT